MGDYILGLVIFLYVAIIMIIIGIVQLKSKKPVGFYSGEKPPEPEQLIDVNEWNKKHGRMWILYGIVMIFGYFAGMFMGDTIWSSVTMCGGVILPLFVMIWYDKMLRKKLIKKNRV